MERFARLLGYYDVNGFEQDETVELQKIKTKDLYPPVVSFFTNILRLKRLQQLPGELTVRY